MLLPLCSVLSAFLCFIKYLNKKEKGTSDNEQEKANWPMSNVQTFRKPGEQIVQDHFKKIQVWKQNKEMKCG